jgi:hypothetical protein
VTNADVFVLAVSLLVSVASLCVAAFVIVNHARVIKPLLQAAADYHDAVAQHKLMVDREVEARIAMINQKVSAPKEYGPARVSVPQTGEPPLPGEMPNFVDPFAAEDFERSEHPRRNERDVYDEAPADGVVVQR